MHDREKVIKTLTDALTAKENYPWARAEMSFEFIEMLLALLKEQEQKTGEWIEIPDGNGGTDSILCPFCRNGWSVIDNCTETFNYCPHCGAKMVE